jgi:N12 class adenine-specific DNA methylase/SAM-dependent methyltransferase
VGGSERRAAGAAGPGRVAAARFRPRGQDDLAPSGTVARIRANLAAIRALRAIQAEGRPATPGEQAVLARWSGWGAVPGAFDEARTELAWAREEMAALLSPAEMAAAARNTLNAHYTDAALATEIWAGVQRLGFTGGAVLEPGCGSGNFIGLAPAGARVTGVELEPATAGIAAALYPDATILSESFADTRAPEGSFDLAIGNVPFGAFSLADRRHNAGSHSIHNHFIIKALRLVRPGGLVAVVTSRYTMDSRNPAARREIASLADLAGAVRLPSGAHQRAAGTAVVTDLLIFRRREPGRAPDPTAWEQVQAIEIDNVPVEVNEYFLTRPETVLGELRVTRGAYSDHDLTVAASGDTTAALARALAGIADDAKARGLAWTPPQEFAGQAPQAAEPAWSRQPDGYLTARRDGSFTQVTDGREIPFPVPDSQGAELRALLGLRDAVTALLESEAASLDDTPELADMRRALNSRYDAYAAAWGPVNRFSWRRTGRTDPDTGEEALARIRPPQGGFRGDPYAPLVQALEDFDPVSQAAAKAAIFTVRVVAPRNPRLGADTPADALAICLDVTGKADLRAIARLLGTSEEQAREDLGTLVFDDPETGQLVPAAEYLSGQVRRKLEMAEQAAASDPRYMVNAAELRRVVPEDLLPSEIEARMGAAWISAAYVEDFLREILDDSKLRVEHPGGQVWTVRGDRHTVLATSTWGTARYPAPALAQAVLEQRRIEVRDETPDKTWVLNLEDTIAAQEQAAKMVGRFGEWAWEEPARAGQLAAAYNWAFNDIRLRSYDDAQLSLPGLAMSFEPRPHQVAAVARIIAEPAVLLAHEVGAGKTAEMVMGAMELRRLGLAAKPAIIIPNHMLEQFAREALQLYPQAAILLTQREDLQAGRRHQFVARCATGNWDIVIMSRSAFERIPMSAAVQRQYMEAELDRMREFITASKAGDGLTVKRLEGALLRAEERLKRKLDSAKDPGITFEATGIDYLFVDEAHGYKNLRTPSNIPDAAIDGSGRASDLDMKISYLRARNGARVVTFATATPIANSITEAHVMQRYLRPDLLASAGIADFDSWAATFGQTVTQIEMAPEGGDSFRQSTRFARFTNVPEMLRRWHLSADIKTAEDLKLPVPALAPRPGDGQQAPETVVVMPSDAQAAIMAELGERADDIRSRRVRPEEDNMLKVCSDGRKAALDLRLVGRPMDVPGKIGAAADRIAGLWGAHRDDAYPGPGGLRSPVRGSLQLVFCDIGTPGEDWNVYEELRDQLVLRGLPRGMIRFVHDAKSDRDKGELFAACRAGAVAVLIGSTEKMGVGTNVQLRAIALHHLDCPWRPADVAQREGRILRQGNHNPQVQIIRYVTERSFDGYMWQTVERKARFIAQVMRGKLDVREIEDIGDAALSYNEVKALATGNPLLMEKAEADADLTRLERAQRAWNRNLDTLAHKVHASNEQATALQATVAGIDAAIARRRDTRGDAFTMTVAATRHTRRADAGEHLRTLIAEQDQALTRSGHKRLAQPLGELGGFLVHVTTEHVLASVHVIIELRGAPGTEIRMTPAELAAADPGRLIVRLEGRLTGLEALKEKTLAEISRLTAEADHARDDLRKPFPQAGKLTAARERAQQIDDQLSRAAAPDRPDPGRPAAAMPDWVPEALRNPDDPRWLAAAAMHDASVMAGTPGAAVTVIGHPESSKAAETLQRDFPDGNPLAELTAPQPSAPKPPSQAAIRPVRRT